MEILNEEIIIEINANSRRLAMMEECLEYVVDNPKNFMKLEEFRKLLNLEFKPAFCEKISIVEYSNNEKFTGATITPSLRHIENLIAENITKVSGNTTATIFKEFIIEIDSRLFDKGLTTRELMAILLHECGHTLSDTKMTLPKAILVDSTLSLPIYVFSALQCIRNENIYVVGGGLLVATLISMYAHGYDYYHNLLREKDADSVAFKCGYGADLFTALEKILSNVHFNKTNKVQEVKKMCKWSISNIIHFKQRQASLKKLLMAELRDEKSPIAREVLQKQLAAMEENTRNIRKRSGNMPVLQTESKELNESISSFMQVHINGLSALELDEIEVEIGRIETSDDKLYLLQRVHKDIVIANKTIDKLARSKRATDQARIQSIKDYITDLKALIPRIKAVKTSIMPYNIVVKYPKGDYEEE